MIMKETSVEFDAEFEQGNLDLALRRDEQEFDLFMRTDSNTKGHHQWFYFSVKNKFTGTYKFNILNFTKRDSLYDCGMRISVFSKIKSSLAKIGTLPAIFTDWFRGGNNILYHPSRISVDDHAHSLYSKYVLKSNIYYELSFEYEFEYENDIVYFAYAPPYTYSKLLELLKELKMDCKQNNKIFKEEILCKTLSGLDLPILTITEKIGSVKIRNKKKPIVIVTARIHPGETSGSFLMEGFLRYISSSSLSAHKLCQNVIFKIIPMLNPDGVLLGNYRVNISGEDLNRNFSSPDPLLHPEITRIKSLIRKLKYYGHEIISYLDFHSHSKKKCVFIYGPHYPLHSPRYLQVRVFANILSFSTEMFRYKACKYREEPEKITAARFVISKEFDIMNSFTIESSFHGFINRERKIMEFCKSLYKAMGMNIGKTIFDYLNILKEDKTLYKGITYKNGIIPNQMFGKTTKEALDKLFNMKSMNKNIMSENINEKYKNHSKNSELKCNEVIHIEDQGNCSELSKESPPIKKKLIDIYQNIQENMGLSDSDSKDSDSSESEPEPLPKTECNKITGKILSILKNEYENDYEENNYNENEYDNITENAKVLKKDPTWKKSFIKKRIKVKSKNFETKTNEEKLNITIVNSIKANKFNAMEMQNKFNYNQDQSNSENQYRRQNSVPKRDTYKIQNITKLSKNFTSITETFKNNFEDKVNINFNDANLFNKFNKIWPINISSNYDFSVPISERISDYQETSQPKSKQNIIRTKSMNNSKLNNNYMLSILSNAEAMHDNIQNRNIKQLLSSARVPLNFRRNIAIKNSKYINSYRITKKFKKLYHIKNGIHYS